MSFIFPVTTMSLSLQNKYYFLLFHSNVLQISKYINRGWGFIFKLYTKKNICILLLEAALTIHDFMHISKLNGAHKKLCTYSFGDKIKHSCIHIIKYAYAGF